MRPPGAREPPGRPRPAGHRRPGRRSRGARDRSKRAITAGPGNPPAVVDQTADVERAGWDIVRGVAFDNNLVCIGEKVVLVVDSVADRLIRAMTESGAYLLKEHELRRLERVIFRSRDSRRSPASSNPAWIGQDAAKILAEVGVQAEPAPRLLIADVPRDHSLASTSGLVCPSSAIARSGTSTRRSTWPCV